MRTPDRNLDPPEEIFLEQCSSCLKDIFSPYDCKIVFDEEKEEDVIVCNKCNNEIK